MNFFKLPILISAITLVIGAHAAFAAEEHPRTATVTDRANAQSQVSAISISNLDNRFSLDYPDDRNRLVVTARNVAFAIPLSSVTSIQQDGNQSWRIKYQGPDGSLEISGALSADALLLGASDLGSLTLPLTRLKLLEFSQPGVALQPARRRGIPDKEGRPGIPDFKAVVTLDNGTELNASLLRRNEIYAEPANDPAIQPPTYVLQFTNYVDFHLLRGETLQIVPFENIKSAEFYPDGNLRLKTVAGSEAQLKIPRRDARSLEGLTGSSAKGDFYVPFTTLRIITFGEAPK